VLGMLVLMVAGYALAEVPGALAGLAGSELVRYFHTRHAVRPAALGGIDQDLRYTALFLASSGAGVLAIAGCEALALHTAFAALAASIVVGIVWLPLLVPQARRFLVRPRMRPENPRAPGPPPAGGSTSVVLTSATRPLGRHAARVELYVERHWGESVPRPYRMVRRIPESHQTRFLIVVAHARSGSSLLVHLLHANPAIFGIGEHHVSYDTPHDLQRL